MRGGQGFPQRGALRTWVVRCAWVGTIALGCTSLVPVLGRWHWLPDLSAHFPHYYAALALVCTLGLLWAGRGRLALASVAVLSFYLYQLSPSLWSLASAEAAPGSSAKLALLQFNVRNENPDPEGLVDWLKAHRHDVDVLALMEVGAAWKPYLERLDRHFTRSWYTPAGPDDGIALFTHLPDASLTVHYFGEEGLPTVIFDGRAGQQQVPFTLYVTHPRSPTGQARWQARNAQLLALAADIGGRSEANRILAGDLNTTVWSYWYRRLAATARLEDAQTGFGFEETWAPAWLPSWLGIPIDHTLVSAPVRVLTRKAGPRLGSDHRPVTTILELSG